MKQRDHTVSKESPEDALFRLIPDTCNWCTHEFYNGEMITLVKRAGKERLNHTECFEGVEC